MGSLFSILATPFGALFRLIGFTVPDFVIALSLTLIIIRILSYIISFLSKINSIKTLELKKATKIIDEKYIDQPEIHQSMYQKIYKEAKLHPSFGIIFALLNTVVFVSLLTMIYSPLKSWFGYSAADIDLIKTIVPQVAPITQPVNDFNLISAIQSNPEVFRAIKTVDFSPIISENFNFLGISLISPINIQSIQVLFPILYLSLFSIPIITNLFKIVKYKKQDASYRVPKGALFGMVFQAMLLLIVATSAFTLPAIYFLYFFLYFVCNVILEKLSHPVVERYSKEFNQKFTNKCISLGLEQA